MQQLFSVPKVGLFLDGYTPGVEKRRGEDVKILTLSLRIQPFDHKLAGTLDDGIGDDTNVRPSLFSLNSGDPKPHINRVNFGLFVPRQQLHVFASPDTDTASRCFDQVKCFGFYARTQKDANGFAFCFKASFGPVGRDEQEYVHDWLLTQRFVTFEEAEPSLEFDTDADEPVGVDMEPIDGRPAPMWDDDEEDAEPIAAAPPTDDDQTVRQITKRGSRKTSKKHDPEAERAAQAAAGKDQARA